jgi:iron complex outermembrane receptor protein
VRYQSSVIFDVLQNPNTRMDDMAIVDLSAGIRSHSDKWSPTFFVNNLTDKFYYSYLQAPPAFTGAPVITAQLPRDAKRYFGVRVQTEF